MVHASYPEHPETEETTCTAEDLSNQTVLNTVYPKTILETRYRGTYSGGKCAAFANIDNPRDTNGFGSDVPCGEFWSNGPKHEINDKTRLSGHIGDEKLREKVEELPDLKVHLYGHNHGAHGESKKLENSYNCSVIDDNYEISNEPVVIQL